METPNYANNRMSAIGVSVIEDGVIVDEFYSLVNPETHFDRFNIDLTGITPEAAADAPTFPELWRELEPVMSSGLLIAHNAPFDMSVLAKCLLDYGLLWRPTAHYACTCQMGRRLIPSAPNHRLDTLASLLDLPLQHHNALSDAKACAGLLQYYLGENDLSVFKREYDFTALRSLGWEC